MKLIEISGKVAKALGGDSELKAVIADRFFPVVVKEGVIGYPFVTYRNLGVAHDDDNKDVYNQLRGRIEIDVAALTFEEASTTSGIVQQAMESYRDNIEFKLTNYEEEFDPQTNVYVSVLTFDYEEN